MQNYHQRNISLDAIVFYLCGLQWSNTLHFIRSHYVLQKIGIISWFEPSTIVNVDTHSSSQKISITTTFWECTMLIRLVFYSRVIELYLSYFSRSYFDWSKSVYQVVHWAVFFRVWTLHFFQCRVGEIPQPLFLKSWDSLNLARFSEIFRRACGPVMYSECIRKTKYLKHSCKILKIFALRAAPYVSQS